MSELIAGRYERRPTLITSNKSLTDWAAIVQDASLAAALDLLRQRLAASGVRRGTLLTPFVKEGAPPNMPGNPQAERLRRGHGRLRRTGGGDQRQRHLCQQPGSESLSHRAGGSYQHQWGLSHQTRWSS